MKHTTSIRLPILLLSAYFVINSLLSARAYGQQSGTVTFYVATTGSSSNPGTMASPFLRPEDARDAIAKIQGPVNATVYIRGGIYSFSKSFTVTGDGLDSTRHITFSNYQNEKVQFTGSRKLDNGKFTLVNDAAILNRLPAVAKGKVYQIDLKAAGITDYGKMQPHGYKLIKTAPLELFYNEVALTVARYPNDGYLPIETVTDGGTTVRNGSSNPKGAKFKFSDSRMNNWAHADNAWVGGYFSYGYSDDYLKVDNFDAASQTISLKNPSIYGVFATADASSEALKNAQKIRGFYIYNLLEEIDQPGEWYLDNTSGILYLYPPENSLTSADIEVSMLEDPILVLSKTWNVTFKGISFECARATGMSVESTHNTTISHCSFDDLGTLGIITNTHPNLPYNTNLLIESCSICNTGTGGVILDGGDLKNLTAAGNVLNNCDIYNYSRINRAFCPAVSMYGVGNKITHCYIHDAPDHAIVFYGNDHVIAYNHIKNVVNYITDAGAVGTGRDIGSTGNVINNNFFDNIVSQIGSSTAAVYLDDGSSGMQVNDNVFYKAGTAGTYHFGAIHVNGGSDNIFKNNVFIDCPQAFSNNQWSDKVWHDFVTNTNNGKTYRPGVDLHSGVYTQKYAHLSRVMDSTKLTARQNYSYNSLVYNVGVFSAGGSYVHKNVYTTTTDPGFADLNKQDFTLTKVPAALQQAADWKPAPFREMGVKK